MSYQTKIKLVFLIVILGFLSLGTFLILNKDKSERTGGFVLSKISPFSGTSTPVATPAGTNRYIEEDNAFNLENSSAVLEGPNPTSTMEASIGNADLVDLNIFFVASTSLGYPVWNYEFSNDGNEWYSPTQFNATADGTNGLATTSYAYEPASLEATTTINVQIEPLAAQFIRINFSSAGATATLHAEINKRNQY